MAWDKICQDQSGAVSVLWSHEYGRYLLLVACCFSVAQLPCLCE